MQNLSFPPSLVFPLTDETDTRAVEQLFGEMQNDLARYNGWRIDSGLRTVVEASLGKWRQRLDPLVPGIRFTYSLEEGWLRVTGYVPFQLRTVYVPGYAAPRYVLVVQPKLPF